MYDLDLAYSNSSMSTEISAVGGCGPIKPRRLGQVIELKPEALDLYCKVHADDHQGVRDLLSKHGLRNFSIFLQVST